MTNVARPSRVRRAVAGAALGGLLAMGGHTVHAVDFAHQNYLLHCSGCHLPDGSGSVVNDVPTLHGVPGQFLHSPSGRAFLAQVPGVAYSALNHRDAAEVLNWMIERYSREAAPADFVPYTAEEVRRYRATSPADIMGLRSEVLADLRARGIAVEY